MPKMKTAEAISATLVKDGAVVASTSNNNNPAPSFYRSFSKTQSQANAIAARRAELAQPKKEQAK